ncbi:MAG: RNA polymerase sigma-70 factor [Bacteroidota bacterium]
MNKPGINTWISRIYESGDEHAFRSLVELLSPALQTYALTFVHQPEIAEELVSDVWVNLWHRKSELANIQHIRAYLFRAVKNRALTYLRKKSLPSAQLGEEWMESPTSALPQTPESHLISAELFQVMDQAIQDLPANCQRSFRLVKEEGMSYREAAKTMDITENTLKTHLRRAIEKLRKKLSEYQSVSRFSMFFFFFCHLIHAWM